MKKAVILAEGKYGTSDGKTAHGLIKFSEKYDIAGVIDSTLAGKDAGEVIQEKKSGIKIYQSLEEILEEKGGIECLIIGVATAGGLLPEQYIKTIKEAMANGMHIVSGLHLYLSEDAELSKVAEENGVDIIDVRKIYNNCKTFFSGKIDEVTASKVAVLGTDSAIGKRTTAIMLYQSLKENGGKCAFVAMGQTGWMQGFKHCIVLDAIVLDFVTGAIEDVLWKAWKEENPDYIVTHGEGAMLHPAYPGGSELIAAGRPEHIVLQHSPKRTHYEDFPKYKMDSLDRNIRLTELYAGKKPIAIALNTEGMTEALAMKEAKEIESKHGIMTRCPVFEGVHDIAMEIVNNSMSQT